MMGQLLMLGLRSEIRLCVAKLLVRCNEHSYCCLA
jgi:hypothetical protein